MTFSAASAVTPGGAGLWKGEIQPGWDIMGRANGGYMMAIAARAAGLETGRPDPVSITAHFLRPGVPGPVQVETSVVKRGRRFTTATATLSANGDPLLSMLGSFSTLEPAQTFERVDSAPPDLPPVEDCTPVEPTETFPPPFTGKVEVRLHPEDGFADGKPSGRLQMRGWFRLRDGEPTDTLALVVGVDAFPPPTFNTDLPMAWIPTVELTTHIRARPEPGWLRAAFSTRFITGGFLEEDGELWDASGRLVAQSRQLALLPR